MDNGYIKLHRKFKQWKWYRSPYHVATWIHILLSASHKPIDVFFNGKLHKLNPGEFVTSRHKLAVEIGISESHLENIIKMLENNHLLRQLKTYRSRVITITNWNDYQKSNRPEDSSADSSADSSIYNKNEKNEKNIIYCAFDNANANCEKPVNNRVNIRKEKTNGNFEAVWSKYPKKLGKTAAERHFLKTVVNDQDLADINKALDNFLNSKQGKGNPQYIPHGSTWFNNWRDWVDYQEIETEEEKRNKLRKELGIE